MRTARVLIAPPEQAVIEVAEARAHLRLETGEEDAYLAALIATATARIDAEHGWIGRALRPQTWEYRLDRFPAEPIRLPYPPLIEIDSVKYTDTSGAEITLDPSAYRVFGAGTGRKAELVPAYGTRWPAPRADLESVRIRYSCGDAKPGGNDPDPLPAPVKHAVKIMLADWYQQRASVVIGAPVGEMPETVHHLLFPLRVY